MTDTTDLEVIEARPLTQMPQTPQIMDSLEAFDNRNRVLDKLRDVAFKATSLKHWSDQGGKPYLDSNGCELIARLAGVCFRPGVFSLETHSDTQGEYYEYTYTGEACLQNGESIIEIGTCSSRDKFFGRKNQQWLPQSEVNRTNIKKKAMANFKARAVKTLLGLDGLSWEDLQQYDPRLTPQAVDSVEFKNSKPKTQQRQQQPQQQEDTIELRKKVTDMLLEINFGDAELAVNELEYLSTYKRKDGTVRSVRSTEELSPGELKTLYGKVKKKHEEFKNNQAQSTPATNMGVDQ